jgi:hypothetical protein
MTCDPTLQNVAVLDASAGVRPTNGADLHVNMRWSKYQGVRGTLGRYPYLMQTTARRNRTQEAERRSGREVGNSSRRNWVTFGLRVHLPVVLGRGTQNERRTCGAQQG